MEFHLPQCAKKVITFHCRLGCTEHEATIPTLDTYTKGRLFKTFAKRESSANSGSSVGLKAWANPWFS